MSYTRKKNLYSFIEYYKILLKKGLIISKSNTCFNVIVLIEELNLRFADMWTYKIFEISNIYLFQVYLFNSSNLQYVICMCVHIEKNVN